MKKDTEEKNVVTAQCDSCGQVDELFDVNHHQPGNETVWKYCSKCKDAHEKAVEQLVVDKAIKKA